MATSLLEFLNANGYEKVEKRTTAREYHEPTIEFYKSGQARLRGINNETLKFLVYNVNETGIQIFTAKNKEQMVEAARAKGYRTCETSQGDPNIRVGHKATDFYNYLKDTKPENHIETRAGAVAWDVLDTAGDETASVFTWEK